MTIEPLLNEDLDSIILLEQELYLKPWQKKDFLYELEENPFAYYFKMVDNQKIIGYMGFWITFDIAQITKISICKAYQGKKLSYILMQDLEKRVRLAHCKSLSLEVRVSNQVAIHVYQKCGFKIETLRKDYYDNHEDAYLMVKELKTNDHFGDRNEL